MANKRSEIRVMLVDDDEFSLTILGEAMQVWANVLCVSSVAEAISKLESFEPNAVVTDLNFNGGPDGNQLLWHLYEEFPWVGRVILTSHAAPLLALGRGSEIPPETVYMVKADVSGGAVLRDAVYEALQGTKATGNPNAAEVETETRLKISKPQAQVLKLIAAGLSNSAIAEELEITLRAAESLIQRTFAALELKPDEKANLRVLATRIWIEGKVTIK